MLFLSLLLVTTITTHPSNCQPHLRKLLEKALINDTKNLITLQDIFYPSNFVPKNTVTIGVNLTVNNVTEDWGDYCGYYYEANCTGSCQMIYLSLSSDSNSFSYSRLEEYIHSENVTGFLAYSEYVMLLYLEMLTFSQQTKANYHYSTTHYSTTTINIVLNDFDGIYSCSDVVDALLSIFSWVSGSNKSIYVVLETKTIMTLCWSDMTTQNPVHLSSFIIGG